MVVKTVVDPAVITTVGLVVLVVVVTEGALYVTARYSVKPLTA